MYRSEIPPGMGAHIFTPAHGEGKRAIKKRESERERELRKKIEKTGLHPIFV